MKRRVVFIGEFPQATLLADRFSQYNFAFSYFHQPTLGLYSLEANPDVAITPAELAGTVAAEIVRLKTKTLLVTVGTAETDIINLQNQEKYTALGIKSVAILIPILSLDAVVGLCLHEMQ